MPTITRSNLIVPEILADAVASAWPNRIALYGTEAVVESATLPDSARGGDRIRVPYFPSLGEFEDVDENTALTPVTFNMTSETNVVRRAGRAAEITAWAQMAAMYADPYAEISRQLIEGARRKFDSALVAAASADGPGQVTVDRSTSTITYDAIIDALNQFGDDRPNVAAVVVHSKVLADLQKLKDLSGLPLFVNQRSDATPSVLGLPVIVSDRAPVITGTPTKYKTLFVRRNTLALWYNRVPRVETDRDILKDTDVLAVNIYYVAHRYSRAPGSSRPGVVQLVTL